MTDKDETLRLWQERLSKAEEAWSEEVGKMGARDGLYRGSRGLRDMGWEEARDKRSTTPHVRNLCAELVEAEADSTIPQPKVAARRREDEGRARLIEDMLRNELDRLPMEELNDLLERVVPVQGGAFLLLEWDNTQRSHAAVGELRVTALHPRQVVPQPGVFSGVEDMDYIFVKLPQTKAGILRRYGVDLEEESEAEPEIRGEGESAREGLVTQYLAYYRNDAGGVGLFSWACDRVLEDLEDFQARRADGEGREAEYLASPIYLASGRVLPPGAELPYYKPNCYPVLLIRNVSVPGQLLGESDVDKIADQQYTTNRLEAKILDKLCMSGSYLLIPDRADIQRDSQEMKIVFTGGPAEANLIGVRDMEGNITQDLTYLRQVYEEARQAIGITDSFQGRNDSTATSGKAKEFSAAQTAGRLESKRAIKNAAWARLFQVMFQYKLAYADEPRPVVSRDYRGNPEYQEFNRYDFYERDEAGEWYVNDQFLFSCDTAAPLAANREAMWQETRQNLQSGAFGDPALPETLILFWTKMELLHYPGAGDTRKFLERQARERQEQALLQQARQAQTPPQLPQITSGGAAAPQEVLGYSQEEAALTEARARQDAMRDAAASAGVSLEEAQGLLSPGR